MSAAYPLNRLIVARIRREEAAAKELKAAEGCLRAALAEAARAQTELDEGRNRIAVETERRWANLLGSETNSLGLLDFREGLAELDQRVAALELRLAEAQNVVNEKRRAAELARVELTTRRKAKEKLESHRETWLIERALEAERQEGLELEEFARPTGTLGLG